MVKCSPVPVAYSSGVKPSENEGPLGREDGPRRHDPKTYGSISGIQVGTWWETRKGCSSDAIHAPIVGGISGGSQGAYSVALSGGYEDDVDLGYAFTFTGSGGRDLKGTKTAPKNLRTAPQSSDQTFENTFNKMLLRSTETKKPVRVIRGFKGKSRYAPTEGYRYDGLYTVERAWLTKGVNPKGYLVCKFAFKRLPGQPPLPVRGDTASDDEDSKDVKYEED
ncbi:PUA-like domain-containing protein, partial [Gymnopilus junonius]